MIFYKNMNFAYLQVIRICNQKCIFCAQPSNGKVASFDQLKTQIDMYVEKDYQGIIINWGEPTLHPDIIKIIQYSRSQGLFVKMITNGIRFSDEDFVKKCSFAWLQHVHISIHSCIANVENFLMRWDVYNKQILWLYNVLKYAKIPVWINIAMNNYNIRHLDKTVLFFLRFWVDGFIINQLEVNEVYPEYLSRLLFRLEDMRDPLSKALGYVKLYNKNARVSRVPMCYMVWYESYSRDIEYTIQNSKTYTHYLNSEEEQHKESFETDSQTWQKIDAQIPWHEKRTRTLSCEKCSLSDICSWYDLLDYLYDSSDPLIPRLLSSQEKTLLLKWIQW